MTALQTAPPAMVEEQTPVTECRCSTTTVSNPELSEWLTVFHDWLTAVLRDVEQSSQQIMGMRLALSHLYRVVSNMGHQPTVAMAVAKQLQSMIDNHQLDTFEVHTIAALAASMRLTQQGLVTLAESAAPPPVPQQQQQLKQTVYEPKM